MAATAMLSVAQLASANVASQLDYFRESGASHCPNEAKLREAVEARLGYDRFIEWSPRRVVVEITSDKTHLSAIIRLVEGGGIVKGRSELSTDRDDCAELISSVALCIAINLDPETMMRVDNAGHGELDDSVSVGSAESVKPAEAIEQPDSKAPQQSPPRLGRAARAGVDASSAPALTMRYAPGVRLGGVFFHGVEPHSTLAVKAGATLRYGAFQAIAEAFAGMPESTQYAAGGIRSHIGAAAFLSCATYRWISGCAEAMLDVVWANGFAVPLPAQRTLLHFAAGARLEATWELNRKWAAVAGIDLLGNATPTSLRIQQAEVWQSPLLRVALGLAVEMRFL